MTDPIFLTNYESRLKVANDKEDKSAADNRHKLNKRIDNVKLLRGKYGHERTHLFENISYAAELAMYLQYKKQSDKHGKMPGDHGDRKQRCEQWMKRDSPTASITPRK